MSPPKRKAGDTDEAAGSWVMPAGRRTADPPRDPKPRFRPAAGSKFPVVTYRDGESLGKELSKPAPAEQPEPLKGGRVIEVRVPPEALTAANKNVRSRVLWGSDVYSDDSDLVAVLQHAGFYVPSSTTPPATITELRATLQATAAPAMYPSTSRMGIRSRAWTAAKPGLAYTVLCCATVGPTGVRLYLEPPDAPAPPAPTFAPSAAGRGIQTRSGAVSGERRHRTAPEVTIQYNLVNEPWLKYAQAAVADRGLKPSQWTSARLKSDVLMLETHTQRYEIAAEGPAAVVGNSKRGAAAAKPEPSGPGLDKAPERFRFARCVTPLPLTRLRAAGLPLPALQLTEIKTGLAWEDFCWSAAGLTVGDTDYAIARIQFLPRCAPGTL